MVDLFLIYMCSKPIFCSEDAQKGKICSRLLEPQKVAPNAKTLLRSCQAQSGKGGAGWFYFYRNLVLGACKPVFLHHLRGKQNYQALLVYRSNLGESYL